MAASLPARRRQAALFRLFWSGRGMGFWHLDLWFPGSIIIYIDFCLSDLGFRVDIGAENAGNHQIVI